MSDINMNEMNIGGVLSDPRLDMLRDSDGKLRLTEQQGRAVLERGRILISASAGSGKTATLIKRILLLVAEGRATLKETLVCVFNDSAQAELRQRLHASLINCAIAETDPVRRSRLLQAIDELPFCRISTIHAFCSSLIRENFEKLDISPVFDIADEARLDALMNKAAEEVFNDYAARADEDFAYLAEIFSKRRDEEDLKIVVRKIYERMILQEDRQAFKDRVLADFEDSPLQEGMRDAYSRLMADSVELVRQNLDEVNSSEALLAKGFGEAVSCALDIMNNIINAASFKDMCMYALSSPLIPDRGRRNGLCEADMEISALSNDCINELKDVLKELCEVGAKWDEYALYHVQNVRLMRGLVDIAESFEAALDRLKAKYNVLSYQDLLLLAAKLLKEYPDLGGEYRVIFVDEYQDVDPLQESIFSRLIKDECFMVGDVKQNIYGFRLADPTILLDRRAAFEAGEGKVISFNSNFRSTRTILKFVNSVFCPVMTRESADVDFAHDGAFEFSSAEAKGVEEEPVHLCLFKTPDRREKKKFSGLYDITADGQGEEENEQSVAAREAQFILGEIRSLVGRGIGADGKKIDYGDIAILSRRTKAKSPLLRQVLKTLRDEGIPLDETNVGSEVSDAERELMLMLRSIDNPRQDLPFAGFLLSYFGGFDEQELADISAFDGACFYDRFRAAGEGSGKLAEKVRATLDKLSEYRLKASFKSVGELARGIVGDYLYDAHMLSKGEGSLAELNAFISSPLAEDSSLGAFLENYAGTEASVAGASANSVRVSTFHKFKGLESPVVFVLDVYSQIRVPTEEFLLSNDGLIGMKYYDPASKTTRETFSHFALKKLKKATDVKEEMRLMYVALTRAKQIMYITSSVGKTYDFGRKPFLKGISNTLDFLSKASFKGTLSAEPDYRDISVDAPPKKQIPLTIIPKGDAALTAKIEELRERPYAHSEACALSRKYSVSQLNNLDEQSESPYADAGSAALIGTAYHKVMQQIDFFARTKAAVEAEMDRMTRGGSLSEEERALVNPDDIAACLDSDIMTLAREEETRGHCLRERSFMMLKPARDVSDEFACDDSVLVQGVIDLLILGDKPVIVDFKTARVTPKNVPEKYKKQLYLYKMAVESAIGAKVDKTLIYSFKSKQTVEV